MNNTKTAKEFEVIDLNTLTKQRGKIFIAEIGNTIISALKVLALYEIKAHTYKINF